MAYLTDYSYRQLIERIEIPDIKRIDKEFFKINIYDNDYLFYFFNQFELQKLFKEKLVLSGNKSYALAYKEVPQRIDNLNYVLEIKGNVKYHKDNLCSALNKGFKNFYIPEPVVILEKEHPEKHSKIVEHIRQWFEENNYTVERYEEGEINDTILTTDFNNTFPAKYNIDPITISQSEKNQFHWYIAKKSTGNIGTNKSFDYNEFLFNLSELIQKRDFICNSGTMQNLSRYDFLIKRNDIEIAKYIQDSISNGYLKNVNEVFIENYGIENLRRFWEKHLELKKEAFLLLSEYFKWTFNYKEKTFDRIFLEDFNLRACNLCYGNN